MATEAELRSKVATWGDKYLGISEGSSQHKEILNIFNNSGLCSRYKMTTSDAWCAAFVSAAFIATDLTSIFPCVECSCQEMISLASKAGIWQEDESITPGVGDVALYDWDDSGSGNNTGVADHVGIVYSVSGSTIKVIEGNYSDTVKYRTISVNGRYLRGYIQPKYSSVADGKSSGTTSSTTGSTSGTELNTSVQWTGTTTKKVTPRKWAGENYDALTTVSSIAKGSEVGVCDTVKTDDGSEDWYYVLINGTTYGFIPASVVTKTESSSTESTTCSLKAGDKITLSKTNVYNSSTTSTVAGTKTGTFYVWSDEVVNGRIRFTTKTSYVGVANQVTAWVNVSDVDGSASTSSGDLNKTSQWVGEVTASVLNVRSWAGTEYAQIKNYPTLNKGNLVDVCDTVKANDGTDWYYVLIANKYYGFVSSEYIKKA